MPFIDYFGDFMAYPAAYAVQHFFFRRDPHWNEAGHELVAQKLLAILQPGS